MTTARRTEAVLRVTRALLGLALWVPVATPAHGDGQEHKPAAARSVVETAFGRSADPKRATRTIRIDMSDTMRYTPSEIEVKQGDTIRFVVKNSGQTMHEMVLGTMKDLQDHAELMKRFPGMAHDDPYLAHVPPGKTWTIVWQFTQAGDFHYGCLVPGHFEAGMVGQIKVLSAGVGMR